jgi:CubicO group peptidase (beta-lactamase class C family)
MLTLVSSFVAAYPHTSNVDVEDYYVDLSNEFMDKAPHWNRNEGASALYRCAAATSSGYNSSSMTDGGLKNETFDYTIIGDGDDDADMGGDHIVHWNTANELKGFMVVERGLIVAESYNSWPNYNNMSNTTLNGVYSVTKSFAGLCVGIMEHQGLVMLNETLWDIWPLDHIWEKVDPETRALRQAITIESLLTHSSGFDDVSDFTKIDVLNLGGANLTDVLNYPVFVSTDADDSNNNNNNFVGIFNYLGFANMLSYIVYERTNQSQTLQSYMQTNYFDHVGIAADTYGWDGNQEGNTYARNGLSLTITHMIKWGQTYLQNGCVAVLVADDSSGNNTNTNNNATTKKCLWSSDWVDRATTPKVTIPSTDFLYQAMVASPKDDVTYGYMMSIWNSFSTTATGIDADADDNVYYCAFGAFGQYICVWPALARVAACQTNSTSSGSIAGRQFIALVDKLSFAPSPLLSNISNSDNGGGASSSIRDNTEDGSAHSSSPGASMSNIAHMISPALLLLWHGLLCLVFL